MAMVIQPVVACAILRRMGLISHSDNAYFLQAMGEFCEGTEFLGDVADRVEVEVKERRHY